jgi:hypothetical protein
MGYLGLCDLGAHFDGRLHVSGANAGMCRNVSDGPDAVTARMAALPSGIRTAGLTATERRMLDPWQEGRPVFERR